MFELSPNYTPELLFFYGCFAVLFTIYLFARTRHKLFSVVVSALVIFIGSEFWEFPYFIAGYLGLYMHAPPVLWSLIPVVYFVCLLVFAHIPFNVDVIQRLLFGGVAVLFFSVPFFLVPVFVSAEVYTWFTSMALTVVSFMSRIAGLLTFYFIVLSNSKEFKRLECAVLGS